LHLLHTCPAVQVPGSAGVNQRYLALNHEKTNNTSWLS
jgi:hypothetical protein